MTKKNLIFILSLSASIVTHAPLWAAQSCDGGSCAGGGSVIQFDGQSRAFLLDRLSLNPALATQSEIAAPEKMVDTKNLPELAPILDEDKKVFALARAKLENWKKMFSTKEGAPAKALMQIIENSIENMAYLRTTHLFNTIPRYQLDAALKQKNPKIETAILYIPRYGSIISSPVWDTLDTETQAGLIIHEALRQVQGIHSFSDLTDKQMQMLVAKIVDEKSSTSASFESWMSPMLQHYCTVKSLAEPASDAEKSELHGVANSAIAIQTMMETLLNISQQTRSCDLMNNDAQSQEKLQKLLRELLDAGILKK